MLGHFDRGRLATVLLVVALMAACSSGSSSGSGRPATTTPPQSKADLALLGPVKRATGAELKLGYIYDGQSAGIDARPELAVAQASVKYVNEHLGGVAGRPLALVPCATNASPAGATDCANQMIAAKVPVVLSAAPGEPGTTIAALSAVKVPYFTGADQTLLLSDDGYVLSNPLSSLAVPIRLAEKDKVKKVAMLLIDLPAAVGPVKSIATPLFNNAGLSVSYTAIAPGTPDMTPQVQAAISQGAQQFTVIGDATFCISALSALKTLAFKGKVVINSQCLSADVARSVPGGINGVEVGTSESLDPTDPQVALYEAMMAHYAPKTPPHISGDSGAFGAVVGLARAMTGATSDITSASIIQTLRTMAPQPLPLLKGQTFKCDHTLALTPAVCSTAAAVITVDAKGNAKSVEQFDATPYIKLN